MKNSLEDFKAYFHTVLALLVSSVRVARGNRLKIRFPHG